MAALCECGCGHETRLADRDWRARGWVKDKPLRFIHGHNTRRFFPGYEASSETGCWIWTGLIDNRGYGRVGDNTLAHRKQYRLVIGPILDGKSLHHLCGNRRCVNPDHLQPLTRSEHTGLHQHPLDKTLVCDFCGAEFQASKRNLSRAHKAKFNICGAAACRVEAGKRSAAIRWRNS
jgi:hypothetical protein